MTTQLELPMPAPTLTGITHVVLPDFSLACGVDYLNMPAGDRVLFGWVNTPPTCVWCHSLGRDYCQTAATTMQGRQA